MTSPEYDYLFRVALVGDAYVGKSTMIRGITDGFPPGPPIRSQTLGSTFPSVPFKWTIKLQSYRFGIQLVRNDFKQ